MMFEDSAITPDAHIEARVVKNGTEISGSLIEEDISGGPQTAKSRSVHNAFLATLAVSDVIKFQFTADDTTVSLDAHATYGTHKDTAIISIVRIA